MITGPSEPGLGTESQEGLTVQRGKQSKGTWTGVCVCGVSIPRDRKIQARWAGGGKKWWGGCKVCGEKIKSALCCPVEGSVSDEGKESKGWDGAGRQAAAGRDGVEGQSVTGVTKCQIGSGGLPHSEDGPHNHGRRI